MDDQRFMTTELHHLSIAELAARKLSPIEVADALIRRVEQYEQTHALVLLTNCSDKSTGWSRLAGQALL